MSRDISRYASGMIGRLLLCALAANLAHAEFIRIDVAIRDMNCESCSQSLQSSLERMRGDSEAPAEHPALFAGPYVSMLRYLPRPGEDAPAPGP